MTNIVLMKKLVHVSDAMNLRDTNGLKGENNFFKGKIELIEFEYKVYCIDFIYIEGNIFEEC